MKFGIGAKLGFSFGAILALMLVSGAVSYSKSREVRDVYTFILGNRVPSVRTLDSLKDDLDYSGSKARHAILAGSQPSRFEDGKKRWESAWGRIDKDLATLDQLSTRWVATEKEQLEKIKEALPRIREMQAATLTTASRNGSNSVVEGGNEYADKVTPFLDNVTKTLGELSESLVTSLNQQQEKLDSATSTLIASLIVTTLIALAAGAIVAIVISRSISNAITAVLKKAKAIADGDLSSETVEIKNRDELGDLGEAVNAMQLSLRKVIQGISENAQNVANASEEFSAVSQQITANSEETSAQANAVSGATEEVNRNLHTVATATEEMSASISEIAKNATEAARVAGSAMTTANETNAIVTKLGNSSAEIGQVIKVITSIAQKTDLLALNATVEAARAGEVGAGFAVVANEVKELAKQTAGATEDISRKIEAIQTDAKAAVKAIASISGIIGQVNEISGTIAAAVEEQSATTSEMSRNLTEAAKGAGQVGQNISGVAQSAQNTSQGAADSLKAAQQLAQLSHKLRQLVEQFKLADDSGERQRPSGTATRRIPNQRRAEQEEHEEVFTR